jgi:deoxyribonucleoside regulator
MISEHQDRGLLVLEAARFYYEHHLTQSQIASKLEVSRPTVSRLLQEARDQGVVRIQIIDPSASGTRLEKRLRDQFGLKHVVVVPYDGEPGQVLKSRMGYALIDLLDTLIDDNSTLGVSWGTTMQAATKHLRSRPVKNMTVVQLNGGVSKAELDTHASEIAGKMGENYHATPYLLPLPAIVDNPELKTAIISDRHIAKTLKLAREADIAAFTVGAFGSNCVLVKADYFESDEVQDLIDQGAVADICSRLIKADGSICSLALDQRTIGIELEELKAKPYSIAVAGGPDKEQAVKAGLTGKWFNSLITDEQTARKLLGEA